jgi:hypothetical protein
MEDMKNPVKTIADTMILLMNMFGIIKTIEIKTIKLSTDMKNSIGMKIFIALK